MTPIQKNAALVGIVTAVVMTGAAVFGAFERSERLAVDLRFRHARTTAEPMSDEIVHVDIDDGADQTFFGTTHLAR